jgi:hypothetical protein
MNYKIIKKMNSEEKRTSTSFEETPWHNANKLAENYLVDCFKERFTA